MIFLAKNFPFKTTAAVTALIGTVQIPLQNTLESYPTYHETQQSQDMVRLPSVPRQLDFKNALVIRIVSEQGLMESVKASLKALQKRSPEKYQTLLARLKIPNRADRDVVAEMFSRQIQERSVANLQIFGVESIQIVFDAQGEWHVADQSNRLFLPQVRQYLQEAYRINDSKLAGREIDFRMALWRFSFIYPEVKQEFEKNWQALRTKHGENSFFASTQNYELALNTLTALCIQETRCRPLESYGDHGYFQVNFYELKPSGIDPDQVTIHQGIQEGVKAYLKNIAEFTENQKTLARLSPVQRFRLGWLCHNWGMGRIFAYAKMLNSYSPEEMVQAMREGRIPKELDSNPKLEKLKSVYLGSIEGFRQKIETQQVQFNALIQETQELRELYPLVVAGIYPEKSQIEILGMNQGAQILYKNAAQYRVTQVSSYVLAQLLYYLENPGRLVSLARKEDKDDQDASGNSGLKKAFLFRKDKLGLHPIDARKFLSALLEKLQRGPHQQVDEESIAIRLKLVGILKRLGQDYRLNRDALAVLKILMESDPVEFIRNQAQAAWLSLPIYV